jgi:hypothetical protein
MSEQTDTVISNRICDLAGALRAEAWPVLDGERAVKIAMRFVVLMLEVEELRRVLYQEPRVLH